MWNSIPVTLANPWHSSIVNHPFLQTRKSTLSLKSSVMTERCADQASLFTCPSSIKQMTPLSHNPQVHDTLPIHFNKLAMDFGRANVFCVQLSNHWMHLTTSEISDWHGSLQWTVTQQPIHFMGWQTMHMWQRVWWQLSIFKKWPAWVGCEYDPHK
jgi:hypothetical protein